MSKYRVSICPDCKEEFNTDHRLIAHLNEVHDYGWTDEEYHQICGNMHHEWREM